jgi:hypothetical protein
MIGDVPFSPGFSALAQPGRRRGVLSLLGLLSVLLVAACGGGAGSSGPATQPPAPGGPDVGRLRVVSSAELQVDPSSEAALSPDGRWLVHAADHQQVCVQPVDGGKARCSKAGSAPAAEGYRWSPDSTAVVFTDSWSRNAHEPDLYLLWVASMTVTSLTPDQRAELYGDERPGDADVFGQPGRDGRVHFLRATGADARGGVKPCSIGSGGGAVDCGSPLPVGLRQLADAGWSHDGSRLAYLDFDPSGSPSTVHVVGADGREQWSRPAPDPKQPWARLAFSADDRYLLLSAAVGAAGPPAASVLPAGGGDPTPVSRDPAASFPTWSPTGSALAFASAPTPGSPQAPSGVWLVSAPGAAAHRLSDRRLAPLGTHDFRLAWGTDRLVGRDSETAAVVVLHLAG